MYFIPYEVEILFLEGEKNQRCILTLPIKIFTAIFISSEKLNLMFNNDGMIK